MKACGAEKNFREIIARNVEGGGGGFRPPVLLGLRPPRYFANVSNYFYISLPGGGRHFHIDGDGDVPLDRVPRFCGHHH